MIGVTPADLAKFNLELDAAVLVLQAQAMRKVDTFVQKVYGEIITHSPQWSQNFASNWNYSVGTPDERYTEHSNKREINSLAAAFQRGMQPVVADKLQELASAPLLGWGQTAYFTNATPDDKGGYLLENMENTGNSWLRPVNLVSGHVALINSAVAKHSNDILL